jgi:hypothetical protein
LDADGWGSRTFAPSYADTIQDESQLYLLKIPFERRTFHVNDMDQSLTAVQENNCYLFYNPLHSNTT